jgi:transposase
VVVSNPAKTRAIAEAKVKTDKVDAEILAQLLAADYLPAVWRPDPATAALRRQVLRRAHIVRQRTRLKNQVHAILHRNLIPRCPAADLFGHKGRRWLAQQELPADELAAATALLRQLDFHAEELRLIDTDLGQAALERPQVLRLMTVPGINATVGLSIVAAVGDFTRFRTPEKLVAYLGLNPRVRQSGGQPASHGRITKAGSAHTRGMLVEAAWSASTAPGPLRAFYQRVAARRGMQVAVVAAARKLTVLCWHLIIKAEDYAYAQPSLVAHKRRKLELRAGLPAQRGRPGKATGYSLHAVRAAERDLATQAETAYRTLAHAHDVGAGGARGHVEQREVAGPPGQPQLQRCGPRAITRRWVAARFAPSTARHRSRFASMFAVYASEPSPDEPLKSLTVGERPEPEVADGWVAVEVAAASLNMHDLWRRRYQARPVPDDLRL